MLCIRNTVEMQMLYFSGQCFLTTVDKCSIMLLLIVRHTPSAVREEKNVNEFWLELFMRLYYTVLFKRVLISATINVIY
jgi:hypothetical protein